MVNAVCSDVRSASAAKGNGVSAKVKVLSRDIGAVEPSIEDSVQLSHPELPAAYLQYKEGKAAMRLDMLKYSLLGAGFAAWGIGLTVLTGGISTLIVGVAGGITGGFIAWGTNKIDKPYSNLCWYLDNIYLKKDLKEVIAQIRKVDPKLADRLTAEESIHSRLL